MHVDWEALTGAGTLVLAVASIYSAYLTRVAIAGQERVRPILTLTFTPADPEVVHMAVHRGRVHLRNLGKTPAFPVRVEITNPEGGVGEPILRWGVSAGGQTDLFGADVDPDDLDGCTVALRYGDVGGREYTSRLRFDAAREDWFVWLQ